MLSECYTKLESVASDVYGGWGAILERVQSLSLAMSAFSLWVF